MRGVRVVVEPKDIGTQVTALRVSIDDHSDRAPRPSDAAARVLGFLYFEPVSRAVLAVIFEWSRSSTLLLVSISEESPPIIPRSGHWRSPATIRTNAIEQRRN